MARESARPLPAVVLVSADLGTGGAERQMAGLASYWAARGLRVTLATWSGPEVPDFYRLGDGVRRVHLAVPAKGGRLSVLWATALSVLRLRALLREDRPAAVLSFITQNNVMTILAAIGLPVRVVVSERVHPGHDVTLGRIWRVLRKLLYRHADVVVAQTQGAARWIDMHCFKGPHVIPNALRPLAEVESRREPLVVAVGRLVRQKGFDVLLQAFARVSGPFPDWRVVIIGAGPEQNSLASLSEQLSLGERVRFAGEVRDIETWLARAGLVVQPSRFEGFPNAVLEAMGMGAAVISADCPSGPAELIQDGINGRLVPVDDVDSLAQAMKELMAQPDMRARLGREAVKVRDRYRQDLVMAQWEEALQLSPGGECSPRMRVHSA